MLYAGLLLTLTSLWITIEGNCPDYCTCGTREVVCEGWSITNIPRRLPNDARILKLIGTSIEVIGNDSFTSTGGITELHVIGGRLSRLEPSALRRLINLRVLNLSGNRLTSLHRKLLLWSKSLQMLDLTDNAFVELPADSLRGLKHLTTLKMAGNQLLIRKLPSSFSRLVNIRHLDLSRNSRLKRIDDNWFSSIRGVWTQPLTLNFSYCGLTEVTGQSFANISVESLSFSGNLKLEVKKILQEMDPSKLLRLELASLEIADVSPLFRSAFYLGELRDLDLSYNVINSMQPQVLKHLHKLENLRLDHNKISSYGEIGSLLELKTLHLNHNELEYLDKFSLEEFNKLVHLDLSYNRFVSLNDDYFQSLYKLRTLDISYCRIRDLQLTYLESLVELNASGNRLTNVNFLNSLSGLKYVDVSNNHVTRVPLIRSKHLRRLNLSENRISEIDNHAFAFNSVEHLDLSANKLVELNKSTSFPEDMTLLNLSANRITRIEDGVFDGLSYLRELDLSDNKLDAEVQMQAFRPLTALRSLNLARNKEFGLHLVRERKSFNEYLGGLNVLSLKDTSLKDLDESMFSKMVNLKQLDLSENDLSEFTKEMSSPMKKLVTLSLAYNPRLSVLDPLSFQRMKSVNLSGLVIDCDCTMVPLKKWLLITRTKISGTPPYCSSSARDERIRSVYDVSYDQLDVCYTDSPDDGRLDLARDSKLVLAVAVSVASCFFVVTCIAAFCLCRWKMRGHRKFPHTSPSRRHVYQDCKSSTADDSSRTIRTTTSSCSYSPPEICPLKKEWV